jgi:hypothetical protein
LVRADLQLGLEGGAGMKYKFVNMRWREMYSKFFLVVVSIFCFGSNQGLSAQSATRTRDAVEILAQLSHCELTAAPDIVLVVGYVKSPAPLHVKSTLSLTKAIAVLGGLSSNGDSSLYVLRSSADGQKRSVVEIDLKRIKTGQTDDLVLKGGDLVFVPHISRGVETSDSDDRSVCPMVPRQQRQLVDAPITPGQSKVRLIGLGIGRL